MHLANPTSAAPAAARNVDGWAVTEDQEHLFYRERGNPDGHPIVFVHGQASCHLSWQPQLDDPHLLARHRMIAYDQRGMGLSGKSATDYTDSSMWADDLLSVLDEADVDGAVLVAYSYGGYVICDYLRRHGDNRVDGIVLVGAASRLNTPHAEGLFGDDFVGLVPGLISQDCNESVSALDIFVHSATAGTHEWRDVCAALSFGLVQSSDMRRAMILERTLDNDDVLTGFRKSALITHGVHDRFVRPRTARIHADLLPNATLSDYQRSGHALHWDEAAQFNSELAAFAAQCAERA